MKVAEVTDQEKYQVKALLYLNQVVGAFTIVDADQAHQFWNIFKRSTSKAGLSMAMMKAVICCSLTDYQPTCFIFILFCGIVCRDVTTL